MRRVLVAFIFAGLAVVACGGDTATTASSSSGPGGGPSTSAGTSAPSTSAAGSGDMLTVTGSLSVSLQETVNSSNTCKANANAGVSAILTFDTHTLQFFLPIGTTTFPAPAGVNAGVAFYNNNDSSQEWAVGGSGVAAKGVGTATLSSDGKHGTVDVDMLPNPPHPNPSLMPIHVKGSFSCS